MELITTKGRLDTYENFNISLNYKTDDIVEIDKRKASFTKSIKLPYTKTNRNILSGLNEFNASNVGYNTKSVLDCFVSHNGRTLLIGGLYVLDFVETKEEKYINVQIVGKTKTLMDSLNNINLNDIDFSRWEHVYDTLNIKNNVQYGITKLNDVEVILDNGMGYVYPLVDFGKDDAIPTQWKVEDLKPCLYLKEYIDTLFTYAGLTYDSDFLNGDYFKSIVILNTKTDNKFTDEQKLPFATELTLDANFLTAGDVYHWSTGGGTTIVEGFNSIYTQDEWYYLPFTIENNDPKNQWHIAPPQQVPTNLNGNASTGNEFICQKKGKYTFTVKMKYSDEYTLYYEASAGLSAQAQAVSVGDSFTFVGFPQIVTDHYLQVMLNGNLFDEVSLESQNPSEFDYIGNYPAGGYMIWMNDGQGIKTILEEFTLDLNIGDKVSFRTLEPQKATTSTENHIAIMHRFNFVGIILESTMDEAVINEGDIINFKNYIPQIKARDFITSVFNLFNLWVVDNPFKENNLIIEPKSDFFDSNGFIDVSDLFDVSDTIKADFLADKLPRVIEYNFKESEDVLNSEFNDLNENGYADYNSLINTEISNKVQKVNTIFSPLITQKKNGLFYPLEYVIDGIDKSPLSSGIKLGFVSKKKGDWIIADHLGNQNHRDYYYAISEFDNLEKPIYSLTYSIPKPFINLKQKPYWNLYNLFHKETEQEKTRNGAKLITLSLNISEGFIGELDLRKAWLIRGVYYRLIDIKNFNPLSNETTEVTLLQIDSTQFDYTSNEVIIKGGDLNSDAKYLGTTEDKIIILNGKYVPID